MANITEQNVVVVYRENDSESLGFAEQYQSIHNLDNDQIVSVPSSAREILDKYSDFQDEVENPLKDHLTTLPLLDRDVFAIVLMPNVPGGFINGSDIVSSTSRLSRLFHNFDKQLFNPLFDRKIFKRFDKDDAEFALIVSRFDGPLGAVIQEWFDTTSAALNRLFVNGIFYFDAFSGIFDTDAIKYKNDLLDFQETLLFGLGLPVVTTTEIDPYIDSIIPSLKDDSFYWGWGAEASSLSYFKNTAEFRAFFYNADPEGAKTFRNIDDDSFPLLSVRSGYAATAGHMSDPSFDGYLRPQPFFSALFQGATIGEAMLFSVPNLDWTTAFFGDPLLQIRFPDTEDQTQDAEINVDQAWADMVDGASRSMAHIFRKTKIIKEFRDIVLFGIDVETQQDLFLPAQRLFNTFNGESWKNDFTNLSKALIQYVTDRNIHAFARFHVSLNDYLGQTNNTVTEVLLDASQNQSIQRSIFPNRITPEGSWFIEFNLEHEPGTFAFYNFEMDVSKTEDFNSDDIIIEKDSFDDQTNWFFENENGQFQPMGINGVTSNFAGKKIRYESQSNENLIRGDFYYFKITRKDQLTSFPPFTLKRIIYR